MRSASEIKTFFPAFSWCLGGVSWIDSKSLPYDCVCAYEDMWLLLTLGLWSNNSLHDLWQEDTQMVGVVKDLLKFLKKVSFEVSRRICESTCVYVLVHRHTCLSILAGYCSTSHQADICVVCRADEDQGTSSRAGFGTTRSRCLGEEAAPRLWAERSQDGSVAGPERFSCHRIPGALTGVLPVSH